MSNEIFPTLTTPTGTVYTPNVRLIPMLRTAIATYTGGQEQRDRRWLTPRFAFELQYDPFVLQANWEALLGFWVRHGGRLESFLFRDWTAASRQGEEIGIGNGVRTEFYVYENQIAAAEVYLDDVLQSQGPTPDVIVDHATGQVAFVLPPGIGARVTANVTDGYFRVRFDMDDPAWERVRGVGWRGALRLLQVQRA